jgi:hypothetical protein
VPIATTSTTGPPEELNKESKLDAFLLSHRGRNSPTDQMLNCGDVDCVLLAASGNGYSLNMFEEFT